MTNLNYMNSSMINSPTIIPQHITNLLAKVLLKYFLEENRGYKIEFNAAFSTRKKKGKVLGMDENSG